MKPRKNKQSESPAAKERRKKPQQAQQPQPQETTEEVSEKSAAPRQGAHSRLRAIVGIGASAGGFDPIKKLLSALPADANLAYVVLQHLDPSHETHLPDLLSGYTSMKILLVQDGMEIEPNHVYAAPAGKYVELRNEHLHLAEAIRQDGRRMPIDFFLRSLANDRGPQAIGVVLSGTGSDGTQGVRSIRRSGGVVIVQAPETAQFGDMPRSAIGTGMADAILPVEQMPDYIVRRASRAAELLLQPIRVIEIPPDIYNGILAQVLARTRSDFRTYKQNTIYRRIYRRMGLNQIDKPDQYLQFLRQSPEEAKELRNDLLIGVTGFFREPDSFQELLETTVKPIVAEKNHLAPIRIWIPGCSSGEEAYSIAIMFAEELERAGKSCPLQIFASDIDEAALEVARNAEYGGDTGQEVTPERLEKFFVRRNNGYTVHKRLREQIIFSLQNLITDPPFSRLDMISCRNVLIYLQGDVQKRIIPLFAFALNPGGFLFLGKSDSISGREDLFELLSKKGRIFRRRSSARPDVTDFPIVRLDTRSPLPETVKANRPAMLASVNQQVLLDHYSATVVIADLRGKILHFFGDASRYLTLPVGEPDMDLLRMARERLNLKIRPALHKLAQGAESVFLEKVPIQRDGHAGLVNVTLRAVRPEGWNEQLVSVIFEDVPEPSDGSEQHEHLSDESIVREMEAELKLTKDELQSAYEEFETSNEELKAANEEVMSMNEELQSANEELETSKEELQSINEELTTVNNQLNEKLDELGGANNDLANLLNATQVGTIFLDPELRIKRFTPDAKKLFNLIESDAGRPIEHISPKFAGVKIVSDAETVLKTLSPLRREVRCEDGSWYSILMVPYRTLDNRIEGVVLTFQDQDSLKSAQQLAVRMIQSAHSPMVLLDEQLRVVKANSAFCRFFGITQEAERDRLEPPGDSPLSIPQLRDKLRQIPIEQREVTDLVMELDVPRAGKKKVKLNVSRVHKGASQSYMLLVALAEQS